MATTRKTAAEKAEDTTKDEAKGVIKDGLYIEENVELHNGNKVTIEVITDRDDLPSTFGSLLAEGNAPALAIAQCSTRTRRVLDLSGATMRDLREAVGDVVRRAQLAAAEAE